MYVILSAAKNLDLARQRFFAALRMTILSKLTLKTNELTQEIADALAPHAPQGISRARRALMLAQQPVLAFLTAIAVGSLLIIIADFKFLAELQRAIAQLDLVGYIWLVLAILLFAGAASLYFNTPRTLNAIFPNPSAGQIRAARFAAVIGGVVGIFLLLRAAGFGAALDLAGNSARVAYGAMLEGSLGNPGEIVAALSSGNRAALLAAFNPILESLVTSTPFIFTGLAVAVGLRGGLFNVGVEGQLFIGAIFGTYIGYALTGLPWFIHFPLALGAAMLGGALWALIPALLKAKFGAHEVINTIMMNYIAFFLSAWLLIGPMTRPGDSQPVSPFVEASAQLPRLFEHPARLHLGFIIALLAALFLWWFLFKSVFGFEVRSVGANRFAARYAGMNITRNIVLTMCLSGALAGLAGANEVLGVNFALTTAVSPGYGFDGIALALLGGSHPFGVVLSALLFGTLRSGGTRMQLVAQIPIDLIAVIQALVMFLIAAPAIIRALYHIRTRRAQALQLTTGWGK